MARKVVSINGKKQMTGATPTVSVEEQENLRNLDGEIGQLKAQFGATAYQIARLQEQQVIILQRITESEQIILAAVRDAAVSCGLNVESEKWNLNLPSMTFNRVE